MADQGKGSKRNGMSQSIIRLTTELFEERWDKLLKINHCYNFYNNSVYTLTGSHNLQCLDFALFPYLVYLPPLSLMLFSNIWPVQLGIGFVPSLLSF